MRSWWLILGLLLLTPSFQARTASTAEADSVSLAQNDGERQSPSLPARVSKEANMSAPEEVQPASSASRPEWVEKEAARVGGEYLLPVRVGPFSSRQECESKLSAEVAAALDQYIERLLGPDAVGRLKVPWSYIEEKLIRDRYEEVRVFQLTSSTQTKMYTLHVLLAFDLATNEYLRQLWRTTQGLANLVRLGGVFGLMVWSMAVAWGYLRIDMASEERYRWPLRLVALFLLALPWVFLSFLPHH